MMINDSNATIQLLSNQPPDIAGTVRQTKMIVTLGPTTESSDALRSLLEAGVSVFRINLACISRESVLKAVYAIRSISTEQRRPVSLLLDTQTSVDYPDSAGTTEIGWDDIRFGLQCGVDGLVVGAGGNSQALRQVRRFLTAQNRNDVCILGRMENLSAMAGLDENIRDTDGIILQNGFMDGDWKLVTQKCLNARKLVVIAPGSAADLASILSVQPDALLIPEEVNTGSYPLQSVQTLDRLIREGSTNHLDTPISIALTTQQDQVVAAAVQQADEMKAEGIVVFTRSGNSASLCAALRPRRSRVLAFTPNARLARRLRIRYALEPVVISFSEQPKKTVHTAEKILVEREFFPSGAKIVFVTDILEQDERTSSVQMRTLV